LPVAERVHDTPGMLVLSRGDVERLLEPDALIDAVGRAMAELSGGQASVPPRVAASVEERDAMLLAMPAFLPAAGSLETKLVSLFPRNVDRPTHQAVIVVFDPDDGTPIAVLDGTSITEARTAAASALATRLLAREDVETLAILGTGAQARAHASYAPRVRNYSRVVVAGRSRAKAEELAAERDFEVAESFEEAVRAADVVCAATHSPQPVVRRSWVQPGTHINSVGYNTSGTGEVDADTVAGAVVVVESRDAALAPPPSGAVELLTAIAEGRIGEDHVHAELGELVAGTVTGRAGADQITLYKSVGVAVQDAAASALVLDAARRQGEGTEVDL
jgi:alanine dehydrogenase